MAFYLHLDLKYLEKLIDWAHKNDLEFHVTELDYWVKTEEEAASIITAVCKMKPKTRETIAPQIFKRITTDDMRIDLLSSIKGVSIKKAKQLIKQYGSIMEIGECSAFELQAIEGIGETLAKRIISTLNSEEKVKI